MTPLASRGLHRAPESAPPREPNRPIPHRGPAQPTDGILGTDRLDVQPTWWGQGIGTELYTAAMTDLRRRRFPAATLWVPEGNTRVRSWHLRLGWHPTGRRKTTYAPARIDDVQYRITLDEAGDAP